jgi:hypothetical protein
MAGTYKKWFLPQQSASCKQKTNSSIMSSETTEELMHVATYHIVYQDGFMGGSHGYTGNYLEFYQIISPRDPDTPTHNMIFSYNNREAIYSCSGSLDEDSIRFTDFNELEISEGLRDEISEDAMLFKMTDEKDDEEYQFIYWVMDYGIHNRCKVENWGHAKRNGEDEPLTDDELDRLRVREQDIDNFGGEVRRLRRDDFMV